MKDFLYCFQGEWKRSLYRWNVVAWFFIFVLLIIMANAGVIDQKKIPEKEKIFKKINLEYFKKFKNYLDYQAFGIYIVFKIPPTSFISNETNIPDEFFAKIDSFAKLQLYGNFKSISITDHGKNIQPNIKNVIKFLISLMALWNAFLFFINRGYFKSLARKWTPIKTFFYSTLSRFMVFIIHFLLVMGIVFAFIVLRGVHFSQGDISSLLGFLLEASLYLLVFFAGGTIIGQVRKTYLGIILLFIAWFFITIGTNWLIKPVVASYYPDALQDYQTELEKFLIIIKFEEEAVKRYDNFDRKKIETARMVFKNYWENYYLKKIIPKEKALRDLLAKAIAKERKWSKFFPGPSFDQTVNEASGRGYNNYLLFYDYTIEKQKQFVFFIYERVLYHDPKALVNFIKDDEGIFVGKSSLPPDFLAAQMVKLGYIVILLMASYLVFTRNLYARVKNVAAFSPLKIGLKKGESVKIVDSTDEEEVLEPMADEFLREKPALNCEITIDGKPLAEIDKSLIMYVISPDQCPAEWKAKHLARFLKRVYNLPWDEIKNILERIAKKERNKRLKKMRRFERTSFILSLYLLLKKEIYVLEKFTEGLSQESCQKLVDLIEKELPQGSMIIDITRNYSGGLKEKTRFNIICMPGTGKYDLHRSDFE